MEVLKRIISKHMPASLGTLVAFVMMASVISCDACKNKGDETGKLEFTGSDHELSGLDRNVKIGVKNAEADKEAVISNFKMKVTIEQEDDTAGESTISFKPSDEKDGIKIKDNEEVEAKELGYFFDLGDKTKLAAEEVLQETEFILEPGQGVKKLKVVFELLNQEGTEVIDTWNVTWNEVVAAVKYELHTSGLRSDNITIDPAKNTFTIKVKNAANTAIDAAELGNFTVVVETTKGDAKINGLGADNRLRLADGKLNNGVIEKEVTVTGGKEVTEFKLKLMHGTNVVAEKTVRAEAVPAGAYTLAVDKNKIEDGSTEMTVTVVSTKTELVDTELEKLSLKIERKEGNAAIITEANVVGDAEMRLDFKGENKLVIDKDDKKKATIKLTIVPGADRKAKFELTLLEGNNPAAGPNTDIVKTVEWTNIAQLDLQVDYVAADNKIKVTIVNAGQIDFPGANLEWDTENDNIQIGENKAGSLVVPAIAKGANTTIELGPVVYTNEAHGKIKLKLSWDKLENGFVENNDLLLAKDDSLIIVFRQIETVTKKTTEVTNALAATSVDFATAFKALEESRAALLAARQAQAQIGTDKPAYTNAQDAIKAVEGLVTTSENLIGQKAEEAVIAQKATIEAVLNDNGKNHITEAKDIKTAKDELEKVHAAVQNVNAIRDAIGQDNLKPNVADIQILQAAAETAFKNKGDVLIGAQKAAIEAVLNDNGKNHITLANDIAAAKNELGKVYTAAQNVYAIRDVIGKDDLELVTEVEALEAAAETAFKDRAIELVAAQKTAMEAVVDGKDKNTITDAKNINDAKARLGIVTKAAENARGIQAAIEQGKLKPGLDEIEALENSAEAAFKSRAASLVTAQKEEIEKVIKADNKPNTIAEAKDIAAAKAELGKVNAAVQHAHTIQAAVQKHGLELVTEINELKNKADTAFMHKATQLLANQKAEIEKVIGTGKKGNTIAKAKDIDTANTELRKVLEAVGQAEALGAEIPDYLKNDPEFVHSEFYTELMSILYVLRVNAIVEVCKKAEAIVKKDNTQKKAAEEAIVAARALEEISGYESVLVKKDTLNEGIQAAINAVNSYNSHGADPIDVNGLLELIK